MIKKSLSPKLLSLGVAMAVSAGSYAEGELSVLSLEEVVVVAQKREQSAQDVPIAVTAMNADAMQSQNIETIVDIQRANPSFSVRPGYNKASQTPVSIRGIGTSGVSAAFEGSVGFYVDGVYRSRPGMVLSTFNDIGGIEILRGPQGTLFGKNTTAGAMQISSTMPSHEFSYGGEVTGGNYDKQKYSFYVEGGLSDDLAVRFAGMSDKQDGYYENRFSGEDEGSTNVQSYKLQALYEPTENFTARLIVDYSDSDETCCFGISSLHDRQDTRTAADFLPTSFYEALSLDNIPAGASPVVSPSRFYDREYALNEKSVNENTDKGITLDMSYEFDEASLRSISSVRNWEFLSRGDVDFGPVDIGSLGETFDIDSFSQEFNLSGRWETDALGVEYVLGLFYAKEKTDYRRTITEGTDFGAVQQAFFTPQLQGIPLDPSNPDNFGQSNLFDLIALGYGGAANIPWSTPGFSSQDVQFDHEDEVKALFGHFTFELSEQLNVVLGLRYSEEEKTLERENLVADNVADYITLLQTQAFGSYLFGGANTIGPDMKTGLDEEEWTYNLVVQYFLEDGSQLYAGYSRGFKAGGIDYAVDLGGGNPWFLSPTGFAPAAPTTYSPEYVDSYEVGLKTEYQDGRGRLNVAVFRMEFEDIQFSLFSGTTFLVDNAGTAVSQGVEIENTYLLTENLTSSVALTYLDAEYGDDIPAPGRPGEEMNHSPEMAGTISLQYEDEISADLALFSNLNYAYRGSHRIVYGSETTQDAYDTVNFQVGLRDLSDRWSATLWCENCLNEEYVTYVLNQPFYFDNSNYGYSGAPRTFGLTLRANF